MSGHDGYEIDRRQYVTGAASLGAVGLTTLAGCTDGGGGDGNVSDGGDGGGAEDGSFEMVHWWTAGGEEQALNALLEGFYEQSDYDESVLNDNPAPGGAGNAIDAAIQSRIIDQDPPSTFQIWPGESLRPYTEADVLADLSGVWTQEQRDAYMGDVVELASPDGTPVSVPINIHRMNNVFYNAQVVEDAGVDPTSAADPQEFLDVLSAVDDAGYTALAHQTQTQWSTLQMWESLFIGLHGVEAYRTFLDQNVSEVESEIQEALQLVVDYSQYFNSDASSIGWEEAHAQVMDGDAAFIHQGDWAAGQFGTTDMTYGEDWDYVPVPGSSDVYHVVMDSFVKPTPNPSPEVTDAFLEYCGTVDAQERFNPVKGSIPPRTDVPTDEFPPFLQDQMDDFSSSSTQPPTVAHGSGFPPEGKSTLEEIFSAFIENWDAQATTDRIVSEI